MSLKGSEFQQLQNALLSAFPDHASLSQMVRFGLDENLDAIASGSSLANVVFSLIQWAESRGRLEELIDKAREANTGNPVLKTFADGFQLSAGPSGKVSSRCGAS